VLDRRTNNCAGLYRLPGMFYENWKYFLGILESQVHNLCFEIGFLNTTIYLLFKKCHVTTDFGEISSL